MRAYDAESAKTLTVVFRSEFYIKDALFQIFFLKDKDGITVSGKWINRDFAFEMNDVAAHFDIEFPDWFNFELFIEKVGLKYVSSEALLKFCADIRHFGKLTLDTRETPNKRKRSYELALDFDQKLEFSSLPVIGRFCDPGDGFHFKGIELCYMPEVELLLTLFSQLVIKQHAVEVNPNYIQSLKPKPQNNLSKLPAIADSSEPPKNTIYWLDINKGFGVLYFSKIGFSLVESRITLYLDASFTIALLRMDFYELYVSTSLKKLTDIGFGLGGLMVTLEKPGFSLTGGLYKSQEEELLYNGILGLKINQYSFQALGSYGEMPGSGEKTFFAYLMLGWPLGGPPYFFVNGLAFGFGVNRSLKLPDLNGVRTFPLVAAAMGDDAGLKPDTPPKQALSALSKSIVPDSGQYFISAGIRFLTYGVLESFVLLNIEMGNRLVISLLGLSNASIPPKVSGVSPIVRAELALKAVVDTSQGEVMLMAALTDRSFLFDPSCKLTGGFAIGFWFKGTYSGDFIVTLGGCHHPAFRNIHYPSIPPLGVTWIINDNISIKGESYFALTPSCMMAGASLKLLFELGGLKAWFFAAADFILKWKPFFYQARVQISVGVSYRISILGIGKTFKVEIGAGLSLWGPEFSGKVRVNWYIISFTIGFGANSPNEPKPIEWGEFADSFIPGAFEDRTAKHTFRLSAAKGEARLSSVSVTDGLLAKYHDAAGREAYVVNGFRAGFLIEQKMPCTELFFNGQKLLQNQAKFGIVPMGLSDVRMEQHVTIKSLDDEQPLSGLDVVPERKNVPSALWGNNGSDPNAPMMKDMPIGMSVTAKDSFSLVHILPEHGAYEESVLSAREPITKEVVYHPPVFEPAKIYPTEPEKVLKAIRTTIGSNKNRDQLLTETAAAFGTWDHTKMRTLADDPRAVLFAVPVLRTTGSAS
ncbi:MULTISPECIES: DUF6603 domain-containing protein [Paenibacillus]|uniref:DUF6603 domain-containing protein n=1 Tax=Paenibacillus albilobatus TaxID=2716884 RepID=A0A920CE41_9BACL|nr:MULTISPECIES: DUF6603 domain-containing protein [Paenibacillus]GIO34453.1 hypothetical protein J2TS6_55940 [Paenibacillus albilobatus]